MKRLTVNFGAWGLAVLISLILPSDSVAANSCVSCHTDLPVDELSQPAHDFEMDLHKQAGFGCQDCHGGDPSAGIDDPDLAHNRAKGFIGAPNKQDIPGLCASCHADVEFMKQYDPKLQVDQLLEYRSSHHGKLLANGDDKVATCVSCHGVHGIRPVDDTRSRVYKTNVAATCASCHSDEAYMAEYGIPTNQFAQYKESVHGKKLLEEGDLAAPTCNNCHGSHGATPPGLTSVSNACGGCHANNLDYFNQSPHNEAFAMLEIGKCETCHGHHDVKPPTRADFGVGEQSKCLDCHSEGDAGYEAARVMAVGYDSLKVILDAARDLLERAERGGIDVSLGKFDLHSADDALIKARTAVHYFDTTKYNEVIRAGFVDAQKVIEQGEEALDDLKMRQIGLAFTIPLILLVALLLYLRVRQMERDKPYA
ncbi:MAG: hypothetical protein Kow0074_19550 [Candidatus Zixiibacteriota bacterium]